MTLMPADGVLFGIRASGRSTEPEIVIPLKEDSAGVPDSKI